MSYNESLKFLSQILSGFQLVTLPAYFNLKFEIAAYFFVSGHLWLHQTSSDSTAVPLPQYGFHNNLIFRKCAEMNKEVRLAPTESVYRVKPLELRNYVQKFVEIVTIDGEKLSGTVYTIDPVSER